MGRWVEQHWAANLTAWGGRRARQAFVYQAFVPDPIGDREFVFTAATTADIADAERALSAANNRPPLVGMETLGRLLLRSESVASSRIEGLVCSQRRLAEAAFDPATATDTARTVLANIDAMREAVALGASGRTFTADHICGMHRTLLSHDRRLGDNVGRVRHQQNWIGGRHDSPRDAAFVPPPAGELPGLMSDLARFANRDDIPAVAQAAIAHAQFETIHPFVDGNGRVGRCLIQAILARRGLSSWVLAPVSLVLAAYGDAYIRGLVDFREDRIDEWCATFAAATTRAMTREAQFERQLASNIARWRVESHARIGSLLERACERINVIPVFNVETLRTELGCSAPAATAVIGRLSEIGVVHGASLGKRNRVWINRAVLRLLDDFERDLLTTDEPAPGRVAVSTPARSVVPPPVLPPVHLAVLEAWPSAGDLSATDLAGLVPYPARRVREALNGLSEMGAFVRTAQRPARWRLTAYGESLRQVADGA